MIPLILIVLCSLLCVRKTSGISYFDTVEYSINYSIEPYDFDFVAFACTPKINKLQKGVKKKLLQK